MINDIDNEFSEIDDLLKDVDNLTGTQDNQIISQIQVSSDINDLNDDALELEIQKKMNEMSKNYAPCD